MKKLLRYLLLIVFFGGFTSATPKCQTNTRYSCLLKQAFFASYEVSAAQEEPEPEIHPLYVMTVSFR
jgi:hypothetical protein